MADEEEKKENNKEEAAPNPEVDDGGTAKKKGGGPMKMIIIILVLLIFLGGGGFAAYMMFASGEEQAEEHVEEVVDDTPPSPENIVNYDFPELLVNLRGEKSKRRFLKASIILELANPESVPIIEKLTPRITDSFQVYLRELRLDDIDGAGGMDRLREEMMIRVNKITAPIKVYNILFKQFLIQ